MNPTKIKFGIGAALCVALSGCNTMEKPSSITLEDALRQVQSGIVQLQENDKKAGLVVSSAQVTFNITESRTKSGSLSLNLAPTPVIGQLVGGTMQAANENKQSASNQITITFQNIFTASKDTLAGVALTATKATNEETTTKNPKDGTETVTNKTTKSIPAMTLNELYTYLKDGGVIVVK
jgi:hypothetical protein